MISKHSKLNHWKIKFKGLIISTLLILILKKFCKQSVSIQNAHAIIVKNNKYSFLQNNKL